jgi:hypothetical protein
VFIVKVPVPFYSFAAGSWDNEPAARKVIEEAPKK